MSTAAVADEIHAWCERSGFEWAAELTCGSRCCWACTLTIVLTPARAAAPDRSVATRAVAAATPEAALGRAWDDMRGWLAAVTIETTPGGPVLIVPAGGQT